MRYGGWQEGKGRANGAAEVEGRGTSSLIAKGGCRTVGRDVKGEKGGG